MYALLQKQTLKTYTALFQYLMNATNAAPLRFVVDFEKAVHVALQAVFGPNINIRGCFYHLTQSTWRKIQFLGKARKYKTDKEFRLYCGQLDALALLPVEMAPEAMLYLRQTAPDDAAELVEYFDSTYVSGPLRRQPLTRGRTGIRLRRCQPLFPPAVWNVHDATMHNEHRTNNVCEGWNNGFRHLVGHDHPSIWKLVEALQKENARVQLLIVQDERGVQPTKRVRREYVDLQSRLVNLCNDLVTKRKDMSRFLRGVSDNIRCGEINI